MNIVIVILSTAALFAVYGLFVRCDCRDRRCGSCPFSEMDHEP